jgi:hypothetical protein
MSELFKASPVSVFERFERYYDKIIDLDQRKNPQWNITKGEAMAVACSLLSIEISESAGEVNKAVFEK